MHNENYMAGLDKLLTHIHEILRAHPAGLSEYDLMHALDQRCVEGFGKTAFADHWTMFQSHFFLFHCLYSLRERLHANATAGIEIHCLTIRLTPFKQKSAGSPQPHDPLCHYYLDLKNIEKTDAEVVGRLLDNFWQRFVSLDKRQHALNELGLTDPVEYEEIKSQYRRLVMANHPDRGGEHQRLQTLNESMRILDRIYAR